MKKILFLLFLSTLVKAQIVQPKSTTTFSNIVATGNFTVNGTSKLIGATQITSSTTIGTGTVAANTTSLGILRVKQGSSYLDFGAVTNSIGGLWINQSTPTTTNYVVSNNGGSTSLNSTSNSNISIGGTTILNGYSGGIAVTGLISATSHISTSGSGSLSIASNTNQIGNARLISSSSATWTTGNTGTVAVLSDAYFTNNFMGSVATFLSPADNTTYYVGTTGYTIGTTRTGGFYVPANCDLVNVSGCSIVNTSTSTAETYSLQVWVNNTTATNILTNLTNTAVVTTFSAAPSVSLTAGDYVEARIITPAWATNPVGINFQVTFVYRRRQ